MKHAEEKNQKFGQEIGFFDIYLAISNHLNSYNSTVSQILALQQMPQRQEQPLEKPLYHRALLPDFIVEGFAGTDGVFYMLTDKGCDFGVGANQRNFVHIPETPVIEIGGSDGKDFVIHQ